MGLKNIESGAFNAHKIYIAKGDIVYVPPNLISDVEKFAVSLGNILNPLISIERAIILWPSLIDALENDNGESISVSF